MKPVLVLLCISVYVLAHPSIAHQGRNPPENRGGRGGSGFGRRPDTGTHGQSDNADDESCTCVSGLYDSGGEFGDFIDTEGDDDHSSMFNGTFNFYGSTYSSVYINGNGPLSFDEAMDDFSEESTPQPIPFLAAFWYDIALDSSWGPQLGHIASRQITRVPATEDQFTQAECDLSLAGHTATLDGLIIVTWDGVQEWGAFVSNVTNTFQVVLATADDGGLYAIFNYLHIRFGADQAVAAFNKGGSSEIVNLPLTGNFDVTYTNMGCPGRVVTRVDGGALSLSNTCTAALTGSVTAFNGNSNELINLVSKDVLTRTTGDETNVCKFRVNIAMSPDGNIDSVSVNVGLHTNPSIHRRTYTFERTAGVVREEGQGIHGSVIITPEYTWNDGLTEVVIKATGQGHSIEGVGCNYIVYIEPAAADFVRVETTGINFPEFEGKCGDIVRA